RRCTVPALRNRCRRCTRSGTSAARVVRRSSRASSRPLPRDRPRPPRIATSGRQNERGGACGGTVAQEAFPASGSFEKPARFVERRGARERRCPDRADHARHSASGRASSSPGDGAFGRFRGPPRPGIPRASRRTPPHGVSRSRCATRLSGRRRRGQRPNAKETTMQTTTETGAPEAMPASEALSEGQRIITIRQLLEAGVHFGHRTDRWNPRMKPYIYGARNGVHIIDLQQTAQLFRRAYAFIRSVAADGAPILFVGTKKQAQDVMVAEAERAGQYYVVSRWLGGTLTNWKTVRQSVDKLRGLERMAEDG